MNARQGDIAVGFFSLALVAYLYIATSDMPEGPAGFPRLIALGLLICGLILIARALLNKAQSKLIFSDIRWSVIFTVGLLWALVILLVSSLGFLIPGAVFMAL
ncbi:MAG: tripartite tricarboxylate transporter TctB family protein, partial [Proteobacteria bacterium]|nr:tripartite tricarboxylate transporter TctB family protein [Pseudomonadota bacterium]